MRLFVALDLDQAARAALAVVSRDLKRVPGVKWTGLEALHVTLRFFGEWPEERLPELVGALEAVERMAAPEQVRLDRLAFLPSEHSPRVFVAVGPTPPELAGFQRRLEQAARELGFEPERRAFLTHVTLARIRDPQQGKKLVQAARSYEGALGAFEAKNWALYESKLTPNGAQYTKLAEWLIS